MKQFSETVNRFAGAHPEIEVEAGTYLGSHPLLSDMLLERIEETLAGRTAANCDNCKYRGEASAHHHHHHHHHGEEGHGHSSHREEGHGHCGHHGGHQGHGQQSANDGHESGHRCQPAPAAAEESVLPQPGASQAAGQPASAPQAR